MPSALLPARDVRLPPAALPGATLPARPAAGAHAGRKDDEDEDEVDSHSHSHSHSGESHSSHSSYARRHAPPDAPPPPTSLSPPTLAALSLLGLLLVLHILGLGLFTRGFLLTRRQLDGLRAEACAPGVQGGQASYLPPVPRWTGDELDASWSALSAEECVLPTHFTYDRAVVLIVDALRYDFLAPLSDAAAAAAAAAGAEEGEGAGWQPHPYQHDHLRTPAELIARHPAHGFLAHFAADPPTTTLQRIKGLTTGTLPTFVDASANFGGGQRIEEDNWIDQLRARYAAGGKKVVFAGDDTWMGLFPSTFDSATPFDSFNVHDLDTVDEGVRSVLAPYLSGNASDDWSLLLLHNLGLDHAGHRFSSTHPSIKRKLLETDALVHNIINNIAPTPGSSEENSPRTLFVLLGDHGMDPQGDHGGDAELEVGAGLFVWGSGRNGGFSGGADLRAHPDVLDLLSPEWTASKAAVIPPARIPFSPLRPGTIHRSVAQIDLVPTLSLLLGQPIPFNSLGTVIPELFAQAGADVGEPGKDVLLRALRLNAHQIRTYLRTYATGGSIKDADSTSTTEGRGGALGHTVEAELEELWQAARRADAHFATLARDHNNKEDIQTARQAASRAYFLFTRAALTRAREVWATFEMRSIYLGLALLFVGCAAIVGLYIEASREEEVGKRCDASGWIVEDGDQSQPGTVRLARRVWRRAGKGALGLGLPSVALWVALEVQNGGVSSALNLAAAFRVLESTVWAGAMAAGLGVALLPLSGKGKLIPSTAPASVRSALSSSGKPQQRGLVRWLTLVGPAAVHAALFASNSTILREDYIVLLGFGIVLALIFASLASSLARTPSSAIAAAAASAQQQNAGASSSKETGPLRMSRRDFVLVKAGVLSLAILFCARMGRYGALCREEHGPSCISNFYATPSGHAVAAAAVASEPVAGGAEFGDDGSGHMLAPHMGVSGGLAAVGEGGATNSIPAIAFAYLCAYALPGVLQTLLAYARFGGGGGTAAGTGAGAGTGANAAPSSSNVGIAPRFLGWILRPALLAAAGHWAADRLAGDAGSTAAARAAAGLVSNATQSAAQADVTGASDATAQWAAAAALFVGRASVVILGIASLFWLLAPMCIEFRQVDAPAAAPGQPQTQRKQVQLLGFGNAFGSTYLLLVSVVFGFLFLAAQPSGQVTLSFTLLALVLLAELGAELRAARPEGDVGALWGTAVALLAHNAFFGTGHQATLSAIQWRTAFVLTRTVRYPWSPVLVVLNAVGPLAVLPAVGVGLGVLWGLVARAPVSPPGAQVEDGDEDGAGSAAELAARKTEQERKLRMASAHMYTVLQLLRAQLGLTLYFAVLTLGSAGWSTHMRRHLMLYKVWTPRFMLAAMGGLGVQVVGAVVGVGLVGAVLLAKGAAMFGSRFR
ncbi:mannose-ethanolamine phosphotransferase gpi13 [Tilletia horrida]|nr:mannose-ethanolamine phosphotransferase gpi13 [Tilletia horrida]